jgi:hypothetical protein
MKLPGPLRATLLTLVALAPAVALTATNVCPVYGGHLYETTAPLYLLKWSSSFELVPASGEKPPNFVKLIPAGARFKFNNILWQAAETQGFYETAFLLGHSIDDELVIVRKLSVEECFDGAYVRAPPDTKPR